MENLEYVRQMLSEGLNGELSGNQIETLKKIRHLLNGFTHKEAVEILDTIKKHLYTMSIVKIE